MKVRLKLLKSMMAFLLSFRKTHICFIAAFFVGVV